VQPNLNTAGVPSNTRGVLDWLDDDLRLGPPSKQYEEATRGPRVVVVDAVVIALARGSHRVFLASRWRSWRHSLQWWSTLHFTCHAKVRSGPGH
jgi:hypothetical protein